MSLLLALQAEAVPDGRFLFYVNLITLLGVVLFAGAVIGVLLRHMHRQRVEEEKLTAMGTATARILHQVKNPLQTILLHAEILDDPAILEDAESRGEVSAAIVGEAERLSHMLQELSMYAAGARRALTLEPIPLDQLAREVAASELRAEVEVGVVAPETVTVPADAYYLRQALENLVRNAREAMEGQADARVVLRVERAGSSGAVRVEDNGPGIPPDRLAAIFEPFVSTKGKGMGLGLSICREIVEAHDGQLEVESAPGRGTTFRVILPLARESASRANVRTKGASSWS